MRILSLKLLHISWQDEEDDQVESDEDEDEISIGDTSDTGSSGEDRGARLSFDTREAVLGRGAELGQLDHHGFDCHDMGESPGGGEGCGDGVCVQAPPLCPCCS